jgi:hypothetical protein
MVSCGECNLPSGLLLGLPPRVSFFLLSFRLVRPLLAVLPLVQVPVLDTNHPRCTNLKLHLPLLLNAQHIPLGLFLAVKLQPHQLLVQLHALAPNTSTAALQGAMAIADTSAISCAYVCDSLLCQLLPSHASLRRTRLSSECERLGSARLGI